MWYLRSRSESFAVNYLFHTLEDLHDFIKSQPRPLAQAYKLDFIPVWTKPQPRPQDELEEIRAKHNLRPLSQT